MCVGPIGLEVVVPTTGCLGDRAGTGDPDAGVTDGVNAVGSVDVEDGEAAAGRGHDLAVEFCSPPVLPHLPIHIGACGGAVEAASTAGRSRCTGRPGRPRDSVLERLSAHNDAALERLVVVGVGVDVGLSFHHDVEQLHR